MMEISDKGTKLLTEYEKESLVMYRDSKGLPTIGCGHLLTSAEKAGGFIIINGEHINWAGGITTEQSRALRKQDLKRFVDAVNSGVKVEVTQNRFDALVILAFNIGDHGFATSTVLKRVNNEDFDRVPDAFRMWNKADGKVCQGLVNRREKEIKLWNGE